VYSYNELVYNKSVNFCQSLRVHFVGEVVGSYSYHQQFRELESQAQAA